MKKFFAMFSTMLFLCASLMAVSVGDKTSYVKNKERTAWLIKDATGSLEVLEHLTSGDLGPGYVVKLSYKLDVRIRGEQTGDVGIFLPEQVFAQGFYDELSRSAMSFGVFDITSLGAASAVDAKGTQYANCTATKTVNINHEFSGVGNKAKVLWFNHEGSIKSATNLEIKFRASPNVPVIGAVEIDVSGVSNNGIGFHAGLDLVP
jgi:hypothetical protein